MAAVCDRGRFFSWEFSPFFVETIPGLGQEVGGTNVPGDRGGLPCATGDHGRVVGYDNQHGYHHRHYYGQVTAVEFVNFSAIEERFEADWVALRSQHHG